MKKLVFVAAGIASLGLAACNSGNNEDAVANAEMNQPSADELNQLSNDAAVDAANSEAAALGTQQQQLETENASATVNTDNAAEVTEDQEQNVSGM
jgi:hypothetical protein